jgi:excisionase family DNA binding protein
LCPKSPIFAARFVENKKVSSAHPALSFGSPQFIPNLEQIPIMPNKTEQSTPATPVAIAVPLEILTPQQVAERLQLPESWVYEQTRNRASIRVADPLPHMKVGRYLRFKWSDVLAWLERQNRTKQVERHRATLNSAIENSALTPRRSLVPLEVLRSPSYSRHTASNVERAA